EVPAGVIGNFVENGKQTASGMPAQFPAAPAAVHYQPGDIEGPGPLVGFWAVWPKASVTPCRQLCKRHRVLVAAASMENGIAWWVAPELNPQQIGKVIRMKRVADLKPMPA